MKYISRVWSEAPIGVEVVSEGVWVGDAKIFDVKLDGAGKPDNKASSQAVVNGVKSARTSISKRGRRSRDFLVDFNFMVMAPCGVIG